YQPLTTDLSVTLLKNGKTVNLEVINTKSGTTPDTSGTITILKTNVDKVALPGAVFDILDETGKVVEKGLTTGSDGTASIVLPLGEYTLKETKAPTGYVLLDGVISVTLETDGQTINKEVINTRIPPVPERNVPIVLKKVDVDKVPLAGAVFDILNQAGTIVRKGLVTGEDGTFSTVLPLGVYSIKETAAPTGYNLLESSITATLATDGQTVNLEVVNTRKIIPDTGGKIAVKGEKTWDDIMNRPDMITVKLLRNGEDYKELEVKAGENGKWMYEFKDLDVSDAAGVEYQYTIEEVTVNGYDVKVEGYNLKNYQKRGTLVLNKVDKDKVGLPGAVFTIYDLNGKLIDTMTTGADGTFKVILPLGMYRVTEVTAPKGYDKKDISRLVVLYEDGKTMNLEIVNEKTKNGFGTLPDTGGGTSSGGGTYTPTLPKTGSTVQPILYILGLFSLFVGTSELRRKPKRV
ncbi:MAG: Cna B-type domain-containing protein, partial [Clostridium sp.]|nr:Cna B-type domain-containing protein [Clostridium sp.]